MLQENEVAIFYRTRRLKDSDTEKLFEWYQIQYEWVNNCVCLEPHPEYKTLKRKPCPDAPVTLIKSNHDCTIKIQTYSSGKYWCAFGPYNDVKRTNDPRVVQLILGALDDQDDVHVHMKIIPSELSGVTACYVSKVYEEELLVPDVDSYIVRALEKDPSLAPLITKLREEFQELEKRVREIPEPDCESDTE